MGSRSVLAMLLGLWTGGAAADEVTLPAGVSEDWWTVVRQDLRRREYDVTPSSGRPSVWIAPNRAHGFRTTFTERGLRLVPRRHGAEAWWCETSLVGIGRGTRLEAPEAARVSVAGRRVTYARGDLTEWYSNDEAGLEQGFTLARRPQGAEDESVRLVLELAGNLVATADERGASVKLAVVRGATVLRLTKLIAWDADGVPLATRFELDDARLSLVVDDRGARYPIVVDPLATAPEWAVESNQLLATLGVSVATAGDVNGDGFSDLIVGAPGYDLPETNEGAAFVFLGSPSGPNAAPVWLGQSDQSFAAFGTSVSTAGDVNGDGFSDVIVGAPTHDNGQDNEGRAAVYLGSPSGPMASPAWTAEPDQVNARFGESVATAGDVDGDGFSDVVVGARLYDQGEVDEGRAYVYLGSAGGLSAASAWTAESDQVGAEFGESVSTAGDVNGDGFSDVIVGARLYDQGEVDEGLVSVFAGSATGLSAAPIWTKDRDQAGAEFGGSVAAAGDVNGDGFADVIIGAPRADAVVPARGRAFLYRGFTGGLSSAFPWSTAGPHGGALLGFSVASAGDVNGDGYADVIVGLPGHTATAASEGQVRVHLGSADWLGDTADWTVDGGQASTSFGAAVSIAGDVNGDGFTDVIVGAPQFESDVFQTDEGRVSVFLGSSEGLAPSPSWTDAGGQAMAEFGFSVSSAGDVNADGFADVIVGARLHDNGETDEGKAYVYHGTPTGLSVSPVWTAESDQSFAFFGESVAAAGDVDGDGFSDVIVGAPGHDGGTIDEGLAFVFAGSIAGVAKTAAWTQKGEQVSARFGGAVASAGDVNGDGFADVVVGAEAYDHGQVDEGRAFAYHGAATGLSTSPSWTAESDQLGGAFGGAVATAGDVNGDGYSDVVIGAGGYDGGQLDEGRSFLFLGSPSGLGASPAWTAESDQVGAGFGEAVASAGDVDGDGFSDVIVGASRYAGLQVGEGRASVFVGSASGLSAAALWTTEGGQPGAGLGAAVATAGDVDADGYADVVVGASGYDLGVVDEGLALVFRGSPSGPSVTSAWSAGGATSAEGFGAAVATAGDVNGDGIGDVLVGADGFTGALPQEGAAFLFLGRGTTAATFVPRQRRVDGSTVARLGRFEGALRLSALGRSPFGRVRAALETEVKPFGVPFDGTGTGSSPAADLGLGGVELSRIESGLLPATAYRWRARLRYDTATSPYLVASRWFGPHGDGPGEIDLRTATCSPGESATASKYGTGKPGAFGVPQLDSTTPPVLGGEVELILSNGLPGAGPVHLLVGTSSASVPLDGGTLLVGGVLLLVDLPALDAGGSAVLSVALPNDVAACGTSVFMQALFVDPAAGGPMLTAQTPGLQWTFGH